MQHCSFRVLEAAKRSTGASVMHWIEGEEKAEKACLVEPVEGSSRGSGTIGLQVDYCSGSIALQHAPEVGGRQAQCCCYHCLHSVSSS